MARPIRLLTACAILLGTAVAVQTQVRHNSGQTIAPVFEGWERNDDGSFNMVFGYMNRNYEEALDVPVGPNNVLEPGDMDQGQPTHFFPRRQQFMFKVRVPADWGMRDLVWTLTTRGHTEKAYATLKDFWEIDNDVYHQNRSGPGAQGAPNEAPVARLEGATHRTVRVGEPLRLMMAIDDDGRPEPRPVRAPAAGGSGATPALVLPVRPSPITQMVVRLDPNMPLGAIWVLHRRSGNGSVVFSPAKAPVLDGQAVTTAQFSAPGTYLIRGFADDGILLDYVDVTVTVTPPGQ